MFALIRSAAPTDSAFLCWFIGIVAVGTVAFIVFRNIRQRNRTLALTTIASTIGLNFEGADWNGDSQKPPLNHPLFDRGWNHQFKNVMTGTVAGFETSIFDYWFITDGGKNSRNRAQTVVAFTQDLPLPRFEMRPEGMMDRIGDVFTHKDIDFDSNPEFSRRFLLQGGEGERIRRMFTPALLAFLEGLPSDEKWHIEGGDQTLILYYFDVLISPEEEVRVFLDRTSSISTTFLSCCALEQGA